MQHHVAFTDRMTQLGYPVTNGSAAVSPYDFIADYFRGARGMMTDIYRNRDKLLQMLDKASIFLTAHDDRQRQGVRATRSCSSRSTGRPTPSCRTSSSGSSGGRRFAR